MNRLRAGGGGAAGYPPGSFVNNEARLWVNAMTTPPTFARATLIDTLVGSLKVGAISGSNIWANNIDHIWISAAASEQAARVDGKSLTVGTNVNSCAFVTDRGYTSNGTTSYIDLGVAQNNVTNASQNSAHVWVWCRTAAGSTNRMIAGVGAGSNLGIAPGTATSLVVNCFGGSMSIANAGGVKQGFIFARRPDASNINGGVNGVQTGTGANASTTMATTNTSFCVNNGTYSTSQVAGGGTGSNLTDNEALDYYNAVQAYMTAVGA